MEPIKKDMMSLLLSFLIVITDSGCHAYQVFEYSFTTYACENPSHVLNPLNAEVILLSYQGGDIRCHQISFSSLTDPDLLTFELMVNPLYHEDPDCSISLIYKALRKAEPLTTYNCTKRAVEKYFIQMRRNSTFYVEVQSHKPNQERSRFKLKLIPRDAIFKSEDTIGIIAGGTIGGLLFSSLIGFGVCIFRKRQNQQKTSKNEKLPSMIK
ncbi:uncharacterized protein LOC133194436 [Saccostrea echinata]|uniref:uncharacterized protein LOC133194436 n=1 Tax=Saccostrea echinata TaxID=191078 RepID=UPI002A80769C|nr:uncharacterized protein LOC133194436 [Saccostrea echinata]